MTQTPSHIDPKMIPNDPKMNQTRWVGLGGIGLGWVGLGWLGLGGVGLGGVGLGWVGLGWVGLGWIGLDGLLEFWWIWWNCDRTATEL